MVLRLDPVRHGGGRCRQYAGFRAVFQPGFDVDHELDRPFGFGLELVLDGLEVKLSRLR